MRGVPPLPDDVPGARCSRTGCREAASTDLQWRNPRIHDGTRVKHWVACDAHADFLAQFLSVRGFLLAREPLRADGDAQPPR